MIMIHGSERWGQTEDFVACLQGGQTSTEICDDERVLFSYVDRLISTPKSLCQHVWPYPSIFCQSQDHKLSPLGSKRGLQAIYDRPKGGNFLDSNSSCAFGPTKPRRVKTHQLDLLPSQLASGKWRFRLGSRVNPTHQDLNNHRKKLILLSRIFLSERFVPFSTGKNKK